MGHHNGRIMRAPLSWTADGFSFLPIRLALLLSPLSSSCDMCSAVTLQASSPKPTWLVREALPANEGWIERLGWLVVPLYWPARQ